MNRDHVKGKIDEVKGTIKRNVGEATDDPDLAAEGAVQESGGKLRGAFGDVKDAAKKTVDAVTGKK